MKKRFSFVTKFMAMSMAALVAFSCGDDGGDGGGKTEDKAPAKVVEASATGTVQAITVKFKAPEDTNWYYAEITYHDLTTNADKTKVVQSTPGADGFYTEVFTGYTNYETTYNFDIVSVSKTQKKSEAVRVSAKALPVPEDAHETVTKTLQVTEDMAGGIVSWENDTDTPFRLAVSYTDPADKLIEYEYPMGKTDGTFRVGSIKSTGHGLKLQVVEDRDVPEEGDDDRIKGELQDFSTLVPTAEVRLKLPEGAPYFEGSTNNEDFRGYWTATVNRAAIDPAQEPINIVSASLANVWHSFVQSGDAELWPVVFEFDLKQDWIFTSLKWVQLSATHDNGPHYINFYMSPNGTDWTKIGDAQELPRFQEDGTTPVNSWTFYTYQKVPAKYFKMEVVGGFTNHLSIGNLDIWGYAAE